MSLPEPDSKVSAAALPTIKSAPRPVWIRSIPLVIVSILPLKSSAVEAKIVSVPLAPSCVVVDKLTLTASVL